MKDILKIWDNEYENQFFKNLDKIKIGCAYDTNGDGDCALCQNSSCADMGGPFPIRLKDEEN